MFYSKHKDLLELSSKNSKKGRKISQRWWTIYTLRASTPDLFWNVFELLTRYCITTASASLICHMYGADSLMNC